MKFDSRKPVDLSTWEAPIKLNRKELRRPETTMAQVAVRPMLGLDGKPVLGSDGKIVMVDAEGRLIANGTEEGSSKEGKDKSKDLLNGNRRRKMQKKTRQVFKASDEARQLKREERYPWVLEDARQNEVWVGNLEDVSKAEIHALFVPAEKEVFKFVPAHRWYKFQKKPKYHVPDLEEAELLVSLFPHCPHTEGSNCIYIRWPKYRRTRIQNVGSCTREMGKVPLLPQPPCSKPTRIMPPVHRLCIRLLRVKHREDGL